MSDMPCVLSGRLLSSSCKNDNTMKKLTAPAIRENLWYRLFSFQLNFLRKPNIKEMKPKPIAIKING